MYSVRKTSATCNNGRRKRRQLAGGESGIPIEDRRLSEEQMVLILKGEKPLLVFLPFLATVIDHDDLRADYATSSIQARTVARNES
jgi:hypothetical protein